MTKDEKFELKQDIKSLYLENIDAKINIYKEYYILLINILLYKGTRNNYLNELINIKNEFIKILSEEEYLYYLILKKNNKINFNAVDNLMAKINESIEDSIIYYYNLLDDLEEELYTFKDYDYKRIPKKIETLIDNNNYRKEVVGLTFKMDDVKSFLKYQEEFWQYVKNKTTIIKEPYEEYDIKMDFYGVWYELDVDNNIKRLKICVPEIVDLKTAQINIHEFKHAYDIYMRNVDLSVDASEIRAKNEEKRFEEEYLFFKAKRLIKK